ncbi:MAG: inorganic diphosphatase [Candidatus Nanohaloarchaeota archaeon]|nr:inorganic diphosphatase [Candidatus Nanohaloarchaeota archaeon]
MVDLWRDLPCCDEEGDVVNAVIEISKGSLNKYELDKKTGLIKLDRVLRGPFYYPADYGLIPQTYGDDNDPLDVLILSTEPLMPGSLVKVRIIGVMHMVDSGEQDDKLIAVVADDFRWDHVKSLEDVGEAKLQEMKYFFEHYKDLQNKKVEVTGFGDKKKALDVLDYAVKRFKEEKP